MVQGQVFLKGGADSFPILFFQGLSFLHLEITLPFSKLCQGASTKNFYHAQWILAVKQWVGGGGLSESVKKENL